jgi:hypothetical protein
MANIIATFAASMNLEPGGAMIVDYDFMLGRQRFRGVGWRGLAALGLLFTLRATIAGIFMIIAKPLGASVLPLLQRLLGI